MTSPQMNELLFQATPAKIRHSAHRIESLDTSAPVRVSGNIRLPGGSVLFPIWRIRDDKREIYGGWIDADFAVAVLHAGTARVFRAGDFFPPGSFVEPIENEAAGWELLASSFLCSGIHYGIEADGNLVEVTTTTYPFAVKVKHKRIVAISSDGTRIPIDCYGELAISRPTFVHVYGGFGKSNTSFFSSQIASAWLDQGFNIALVHTRGGAEYGASWHEQAQRHGRALVRCDVAAALRALHDQRICSPRQTFLHGMSHGALVVASTAMHSPGLANHYVCRVPIATTRNIHLNSLSREWISEYGDPRTSDWDAFMKYEDPIATPVYGSLKGTSWFVSAYIDDEVTPVAHADLLAEKLRANQAELTYYRYCASATHQGASSTQVRQEHSAQLWAYLTTHARHMDTTHATTPAYGDVFREGEER
ncbi:Prolyl endopeptidase precursor [Trueperella pyogenes]|nr:Prolyl endopeptidase precursor [Trueperella pyogenes]